MPSPHMNNQQNNNHRDTERGTPSGTTMRRMLPFVVEFVKFVTGFAVIVAIALLALHFASAAMQ